MGQCGSCQTIKCLDCEYYSNRDLNVLSTGINHIAEKIYTKIILPLPKRQEFVLCPSVGRSVYSKDSIGLNEIADVLFWFSCKDG